MCMNIPKQVAGEQVDRVEGSTEVTCTCVLEYPTTLPAVVDAVEVSHAQIYRNRSPTSRWMRWKDHQKSRALVSRNTPRTAQVVDGVEVSHGGDITRMCDSDIVTSCLMDVVKFVWVTKFTDPPLVDAVEFTGVTKFTDPFWWMWWNLQGSQDLLTRFGGYGGSIPGHKIALTPFWWMWWKRSRSKNLFGGCGGSFYKGSIRVVEAVESGVSAKIWRRMDVVEVFPWSLIFPEVPGNVPITTYGLEQILELHSQMEFLCPKTPDLLEMVQKRS
ncbi:hypothetical protein B0H14DRAFT_2591608 [Mycena olivaceomarginata]|nr:hypothetical protein B0H14DRAFT_2591608 [Mycena olivaceomarginata]